MNKNILIAATVAAGLVFYLLYRKKYSDPEEYLGLKRDGNPHHLTEAFAKAKRQAINTD